MDDEYGTCSVCGNQQRLTARGNLYQHQRRDRSGSCMREQCDGAGKPPKAEGVAGKPKPFWQCQSCKTWTEETVVDHVCGDISNRITLDGTPLRIRETTS